MKLDFKQNPFSLYIHIPFCDRICIYCDFCVTTRKKTKPDYIESLLAEMEIYKSGPGLSIPDTVYFGGGTPSVLTGDEFYRIMDNIRRIFGYRSEAEITLEANPNHLSRDKIVDTIKAGFNRISIGAQSFIDKELKFLTRMHDPETLDQAMTTVRGCGYNNINIDLIFGLHGQTENDWLYNLRSALTYRPEHLSIYNLTVETGTYLDKFVRKTRPDFPDDEQQLRMFLAADDVLVSSGYRHYEISNYALPGFESKHNRSYWSGKPYLGLGTGSHSYDGSTRWWNTSDIRRYIDNILNKRETAVEGYEPINLTERLEELIFLGLRTDSGISIAQFESLSGLPFCETFSGAIDKYHEVILFDGNGLRLTPSGFFICNSVCREFIACLPETSETR